MRGTQSALSIVLGTKWVAMIVTTECYVYVVARAWIISTPSSAPNQHKGPSHRVSLVALTVAACKCMGQQVLEYCTYSALFPGCPMCMGVSGFHLHIIPLATFNFVNAIAYSSLFYTHSGSCMCTTTRVCAQLLECVYVEYFISVTLPHLHYVHLHVCRWATKQT